MEPLRASQVVEKDIVVELPSENLIPKGILRMRMYRILSRIRSRKVLIVITISLLLIGVIIWNSKGIIDTPSKIMLTNVTSSSATISWISNTRSPGVVITSDVPFESDRFISIDRKDRYYDDRDVAEAELRAAKKNSNAKRNADGVSYNDIVTEVSASSKGNYYTHHVTLRGLSADTEYYFALGDGKIFNKGTIVQTNEDSFKTFSDLEQLNTPNPSYGKVIETKEPFNGSNDALVYVQLDYGDGLVSQFYSSTTAENGTWYIDFSSPRTQLGKELPTMHEDMSQNVYVEAGKNGGVGMFHNPTSDDAPMRYLRLTDLKTKASGLLGANRSKLVTLSTPLITPANAQQPACNYYSCSNQLVNGQIVPGFCTTDYCQVAPSNPCNVDSCGDSDPPWVQPPPPPDGESPTNNGDTDQEESEAGDDCTNRSCGDYGYCITGPNPNDGGWGCSCAHGSDIPPSTTEYKNCPLPPANTPEEELPYGCVSQGCGNKECGTDNCGNLCPIYADDPGCDENEYCDNQDWVCKQKPALPEANDAPEEEEEEEPAVAEEPNPEDSEYVCCATGEIAWITKSECRGRGSGSLSYYSTLGEDECRDEDEEDAEQVTEVALPTDPGRACSENPDSCPRTNEGMEYTVYEECYSQCKHSGLMGFCDPEAKFIRECEPINGNCEGDCDLPGYQCLESNSMIRLYITIYKCSYPQSNVPVRQMDNGSLITNLTSKTYAQEENGSVYFDPVTGVYIFGEGGVYSLVYEGIEYEITLSADTDRVIFFLDTNSNGIRDASEVTLAEDVTNLSITKESEVVSYNLKEGFNFIHFPLLMQDYNSASALLNYLENKYGQHFLSIASFDSTWKVVGSNGNDYNVNDFQIYPGEGYLLKVDQDTRIDLAGYKVLLENESDSAPIDLSPGWNLIGLYGTGTKSYTAESLIDSVNQYEPVDFTADNVTRWPTDKGRYEGLQKDPISGGVYGFDFPLDQQNAYFVRILQGEGSWEPTLEE